MHSRREQSVLVLYETHASAEVALEAFEHAGLAMSNLSLLACEDDLVRGGMTSHAASEDQDLDRDRWAKLANRLSGRALVSVPGIGRLVVTGPLVERVESALEGGVLGGAACLLRATLAGIGVADGSIVKYALALRAGSVLVLVHGRDDILGKAKVVLKANGSTPRMARVSEQLRALGDGS